MSMNGIKQSLILKYLQYETNSKRKDAVLIKLMIY